MSPAFQTAAAAAVVTFTATLFALRWWRNRRRPGCGGCGTCAPADAVKNAHALRGE